MSKPPLRDRLFQQQHGLCWLCTEPMIEHLREHPLAATIDHLVARGNGGRNNPRNKLLAHQDCNQKRGRAPNPTTKLTSFKQAQISKLHLISTRRTAQT